MRHLAALGTLVLLALTGCGGGAASPFISAPPVASFSLNPSPLELTSDAPAATVTAQGDTAGVQYTPHAGSACTGATGSIAVAGDGIAQLDVAGAPLMFIAVATGASPPASCDITVSGSDGSSATFEADYSVITVDTNSLVAASLQRVSMTGAIVSPSTITISKPNDAVTINASGFTGLTKSSVSCTSTQDGVSVFPATFSGSGTLVVAPYGQGALSGTCTVTFTDSASTTAKLIVSLNAAALKKLTVAPDSVQFACAGASPQTCTTQNVTIAESGTPTFRINTRPKITGSCANLFNGPLKMTTGNGTYVSTIDGPQATVSFYGLLSSATLNCTKVVIGDGAQTVAVKVNPTLASGTTVATAPGCTGTDPLVAVPNAPHGMYVWNPYEVQGGTYEPLIEQYVIGTTPGKVNDPAFCGASILVPWSKVEKTKDVYTWSAVDTWVAPYVKAGLRVNLLFVDASEVGANNSATPDWVFTQDNVAKITCPGQPPYPNWIDPTFEADYKAFITAAITHFGTTQAGSATYEPNIGYMRFGIGAGTEAYPGHIERPPVTASNAPCYNAMVAHGWSYAAWVQHSKNVINDMAAVTTAKQMMIAINYVPTYATNTGNDQDTYTYANAVAAAAAAAGVGIGTENLGTSKVAGAQVAPTACNPTLQMINLYWCQPFNRHLGAVPFEFQPIASPVNPVGYDLTMPHLLQYALDNNAQILELYPQDWVFNDDPAEFPNFPSTATGSTSAEYAAAFQATSLMLGRNH